MEPYPSYTNPYSGLAISTIEERRCAVEEWNGKLTRGSSSLLILGFDIPDPNQNRGVCIMGSKSKGLIFGGVVEPPCC